MILTHECHVFELRIETKFAVCDSRSFLFVCFFFNATYAVTEKSEKFRPKGDSNPDLCDAGAVLYQFSYRAKWELIVIWVDYKPGDNEYRST